MRAAVMRDWQLRVDDLPDPTPGPGQVLTKVLACGICGSDLHMLVHGEESRRLSDELSDGMPADPMAPKMFDPHQDTVMGHEFCCEVVELGPGCENLKVGDVVVSMPVSFDANGVHPLGYSNVYNGGYAELMVLNELMGLKVPTGLPAQMAALTEPLAVGAHAVVKSRIVSGESAIVLGCGPVGLACIAELRLRGIGPIVAADFSPKRRQLAEQLGADVVVDPRETPAIEAWRKVDGAHPLVIFEAVGVPGMIEQAMRMAPRDSRILVVGACMQEDRIHPMLGIGRELNIQFVLAYTPDEFAGALADIADGRVDLSPWLTGTVGVDGVPQAFADLGNPEAHAKIVVVPGT
ncbi:MAG: zinc-binding dehydrogenase [Acidimicrobiales bacterium]|nr:zinc-binding dehydrogenase [Acidimicrobiales bacterium]MCB9393058.1 zinc-binding dehydrogenase [Acidimicrobiaceae bacterium]